MNRFLYVIMWLFVSCETGPQQINFGKDVCDYCKMTIMDKKFGAELMNSKGKTQKFDAAECMINYIKRDVAYIPKHYYVINYETTEELINAETAIYLQGGQVRSPMGGKLAAFRTKEAAEKFQQELQGTILSWDEVKRLEF